MDWLIEPLFINGDKLIELPFIKLELSSVRMKLENLDNWLSKYVW